MNSWAENSAFPKSGIMTSAFSAPPLRWTCCLSELEHDGIEFLLSFQSSCWKNDHFAIFCFFWEFLWRKNLHVHQAVRSQSAASRVASSTESSARWCGRRVLGLKELFHPETTETRALRVSKCYLSISNKCIQISATASHGAPKGYCRDPFLAFRVQWAPWGHSPEPKRIHSFGAQTAHVIMSSHVITSSTSSTSVFSFWAFCIFYEELMKKTSIVVTCRILKRFGGFANYSIQIISWFKWVVRLSQSKEPKKCMHDSVFQNACLSHGSPL